MESPVESLILKNLSQDMKKEKIKIWQELIKMSQILLWKNKITALIIYTGLLLNLIIWGLLGWLLIHNKGIIIEHYNVFFGIDKMINLADRDSWWELLSIPLGGLIFLVLSFIMSILLMIQFNSLPAITDKKINDLITNKSIGFVSSRLLLIGAWVLQLILIVYSLMILRIN